MSANDWGVSDIGFYKPTYEEIVLEKEKQAKLLFGDDFDTSELTPQGKFIRLNAKDEARLYDQLEFTYYCINPGTATGVSLDRICKFVAIKRTPATYAVKILRVYGKKDYIIQSGVLFKSENNIQFWSTSESTINKEELTQDDAVMYYADVTVQCVSAGTVGNITDIVSTAAVDVNITQVTYLTTVAVGQEAESDSELRERFNNVVQGLGTNTTSAIKANVLRIPGVTNVDIIDNNTSEDIVIDDLTVYAKSYAVIVNSDDLSAGDEIAKAIFEKQPLGILQSGDELIVVKDDSGTEHNVRFTYVTTQEIEIAVGCNVTRDFPSTGADDIRRNITNYINGLEIGDKVVYSRLYDYIYNVAGVDDVTSLTLNGGTSNIALSRLKIPAVGAIAVEITEV